MQRSSKGSLDAMLHGQHGAPAAMCISQRAAASQAVSHHAQFATAARGPDRCDQLAPQAAVAATNLTARLTTSALRHAEDAMQQALPGLQDSDEAGLFSAAARSVVLHAWRQRAAASVGHNDCTSPLQHHELPCGTLDPGVSHLHAADVRSHALLGAEKDQETDLPSSSLCWRTLQAEASEATGSNAQDGSLPHATSADQLAAEQAAAAVPRYAASDGDHAAAGGADAGIRQDAAAAHFADPFADAPVWSSAPQSVRIAAPVLASANARDGVAGDHPALQAQQLHPGSHSIALQMAEQPSVTVHDGHAGLALHDHEQSYSQAATEPPTPAALHPEVAASANGSAAAAEPAAAGFQPSVGVTPAHPQPSDRVRAARKLAALSGGADDFVGSDEHLQLSRAILASSAQSVAEADTFAQGSASWLRARARRLTASSVAAAAGLQPRCVLQQTCHRQYVALQEFLTPRREWRCSHRLHVCTGWARLRSGCCCRCPAHSCQASVSGASEGEHPTCSRVACTV